MPELVNGNKRSNIYDDSMGMGIWIDIQTLKMYVYLYILGYPYVISRRSDNGTYMRRRRRRLRAPMALSIEVYFRLAF